MRKIVLKVLCLFWGVLPLAASASCVEESVSHLNTLESLTSLSGDLVRLNREIVESALAGDKDFYFDALKVARQVQMDFEELKDKDSSHKEEILEILEKLNSYLSAGETMFHTNLNSRDYSDLKEAADFYYLEKNRLDKAYNDFVALRFDFARAYISDRCKWSL